MVTEIQCNITPSFNKLFSYSHMHTHTGLQEIEVNFKITKAATCKSYLLRVENVTSTAHYMAFIKVVYISDSSWQLQVGYYLITDHM